ncbi:hypothetical protein [Phyllobacterium phragmitis]|uniref:Uncharacterized protein n=1 Tax=Phyllobacterium phragmitis TaxID=2670329 RepID=A0ABQ0H5N2_9HYPH
MGDRGTVWVSVDNVAHTISVYSFNSNGVLSMKPIVSDWPDITQKNGPTPAPHNDREGSSFFADVTGDNIPDLVYSVDRTTNGIEVLTGHRDGTFNNAGTFTDLTALGSVSNWAGDTTKDINAMRSTFLEDINGDGKLDWVHGSRAEGSLEAFIGNGDGTFSNTPIASSIASSWSWGSTLIAQIGKTSIGTAADSTHSVTDMNGHVGNDANVTHVGGNDAKEALLLVDDGINLDTVKLHSSVDHPATAHSDVSALTQEDIAWLLEKPDVQTLQLSADAEDHAEAKTSDNSHNSAHEQDLDYHSLDALGDFHQPIEEHAELLAA